MLKGHALFAVALVFASTAAAHENPYPGRPGLAYPEATPEETANCSDLEKTVSGFNPPVEERVDLWASGPITMVETDKVLWYVAICALPGARVLCVTYSENGMKVGDMVTVRGAMRIQDAHHIVLDPCLASRD
ncbi:hypothetical protein FHX08_005667 [Rhizobium sp. BK529]|uniref:hypothetical protein n=1 Tax=Rhizobium sp. BK529 TaxID=2586983 RepID=UPI0016081747|nr:hypothetical protein [Rhizobium sp. BK529]MBB3595257.1 hypothetical protein [Rhizobium sp. BK529]